jgi:hypothetical protein
VPRYSNYVGELGTGSSLGLTEKQALHTMPTHVGAYIEKTKMTRKKSQTRTRSSR